MLLAKELEQVWLPEVASQVCAQICVYMPTCTQVSNQLGDEVTILKVDVDKNPQLSSSLQVRVSCK